jgi:uncharacterized protein DUF4326
MVTPRVLNRRQYDGILPEDNVPGAKPNSVYVGRPSKYGNPFEIGQDGTRQEVIAKYKEWINQPEQAGLRAEMRRELKGKDLVCWCAPQACHADIILKGVNQ